MIKNISIDYRFISKIQSAALGLLNVNSRVWKKKFIFKTFYVTVKLKVDNKRSLSKYVTLRAPKHFKVGRHPYQSCKKKIIINLNIRPKIHKVLVPFYKPVFFLKIIHVFYKFFSNKILYIPLSTLGSIKFKTSVLYSFKNKIFLCIILLIITI